MSRLIVVSNRVSAAGSPGDGAGRRPGGGAGGGAAANIPASGSAGAARPSRPSPARSHPTECDDVTVATVDLEEADYHEYYNGYANGTLWPLFHYRIDLTAYDRSFGEGYERVNRRFAETLAPLIEPDDLIWVHDYHLIPLGRELRRPGRRPTPSASSCTSPGRRRSCSPPCRGTASWSSRCSPTTWWAFRPTSGCGRSNPMCWARRTARWAQDGRLEAFGTNACARRSFPSAWT